MRLTDVDAAIDFVRNDEYGITWDAEKVIFFLNTLQTVEAIPVEQVARMLDKASHCPPCIALSMPGIDDIDKWCDENCRLYIDTDKRDCWLHAIKEGWLDDDTNTQD